MILLALLASRLRGFPTEEERGYFGWWYGADAANPDQPRAWISEFREDGMLQITFGRYARRDDGQWRLTTTVETGTWRVRGGVQTLITEDPENTPTLERRWAGFRETGHWMRPRYYRTAALNEHEMLYQMLPDGREYRALRSPTIVVLPVHPLAAEHWRRQPGSAAK